MPAYQSRYGDTITELLSRRGDIAAQGAMRSGEIWGSTVAGLGNLAANTYADYSQQKQQQKNAEMQAKAFDDAISTFSPDKPLETYRKLATVYGAEGAMNITKGLQGFSKLQEKPDPKAAMELLPAIAAGIESLPESERAKVWGPMHQLLGASGLDMKDVPTEYDPQTAPTYLEFAKNLNKKDAAGKAPDRVEQNGVVYERQADGVWKPAVGLPTEAPKAENLSAEEAYIRAQYGQNPTPQQLLEGRARFSAAGRAPEKPPERTELTLNPEGVVLSGYGEKTRNEARRQAAERGIPVFENATTQKNGVLIGGIAADAQELSDLLEDPEVQASIGPGAGRWTSLKGKVFDLPEKVQRAIQLSEMLSDSELRKRSGAAASNAEMSRIRSFSVSTTMPLGNMKTNLKKMRQSAARDYKAISGVNPANVTLEDMTPGASNTGGTNDPPPDMK